MEVYFETEQLEYLYKTPIQNLRGKQEYPVQIIQQYKRAVFFLTAMVRLDDLRLQRGYRFEYLKGIEKDNVL
jgi:hypothetical protein